MNKVVFGIAATVAATLALAGVIPPEFAFFAATLVGVACFHHQVLVVALSGLAALTLYKLAAGGFDLPAHFLHEAPLLVNLLGLLVGFEVLANMFSRTKIPDLLPKWLPDDWRGAFALLAIVWLGSGFLDNIAAAMIGGAVAGTVFRDHDGNKKVHVGYLAALVAASNAGGAGSVLGDTTTTMMWIDGVAAVDVLHGYIASFVALITFGIPAAILQDRYQRIRKDAPVGGVKVEGKYVVVVVLILGGAIVTNVLLDFPAAGVWGAILIALAAGVKVEWHELPKAAKGAAFLLSLVLCASMMPVDKLPAASWESTFGLGFLSSVFDNIPLTKLALDQGGFDWGLLAFAVGFGGSMMWFGSSAGVAISNDYPEARSVTKWLRHGWFVIVAYVAGFFVQLAILGWEPHAPHKDEPADDKPAVTEPTTGQH